MVYAWGNASRKPQWVRDLAVAGSVAVELGEMDGDDATQAAGHAHVLDAPNARGRSRFHRHWNRGSHTLDLAPAVAPEPQSPAVARNAL